MKFTPITLLAIAASFVSANNDKIGWTGTIATKDGGLGGTVKVINTTSLMIENYTLKDASAPALHWWGATGGDISTGFRISMNRVDMAATSNTLEIPLDAGKTTDDFSEVGLWCESLHANFGQATLTMNGTASQTTSSSTSSSSTATASAAATSTTSSGAATTTDHNIAVGLFGVGAVVAYLL
ncbi:Hypothetical protein R9X50_00727100 [Acrodontium crateriforme]|uniref:DM13 domain-containing protein n=1 Tax=Acrodontium crateriforme TaxID=150365 RepID=A0AAQ3RCN6_9PEZI|nr:Hypothetical protein R9X50_00727100 [Acrodontium crateriforme]